MVALLPPLPFDDAAAWRLRQALDGLAHALDDAGIARADAVAELDDWTGGARREFDSHSGPVQRRLAALAGAVRAAAEDVDDGVRRAAVERQRRRIVNDRRLREAAREQQRLEEAARASVRTGGGPR